MNHEGKLASGAPLLPFDGLLRFDHGVMDVDHRVLGLRTALEVGNVGRARSVTVWKQIRAGNFKFVRVWVVHEHRMNYN